jgi:type IV secretory pathway VirB2 component (pilin)
MKTPQNKKFRQARRSLSATIIRTLILALFSTGLSFAQTSPWEAAVKALEQSFTGPIARGLSLVAVVIGGLTFAYSEGGSKKVFAGIVFGIGMALGAASFIAWLFPAS